MCVRQCGQCETESWKSTLRIALCGNAELGERRVELHSRAEKQHVAFERREVKSRAKVIEGRWPRQVCRGAIEVFEQRVTFGVVGRTLVIPMCVLRQRVAHQQYPGHQVLLVGVGPIHSGCFTHTSVS